MPVINKKVGLDAQYQGLISEYTAVHNGIQTVIVINFAISIGIIAALITVFTADNINNFLISILAGIGVLDELCSIQTLHLAREQQMLIQKSLVAFEKRYCKYQNHKNCYYKAIHITLSSFWLLLIIFLIVLSASLIDLLIPQYYNIISVLITFVVLSLVSIGIITISNFVHQKKEKELLKKFNIN